MNAFKGESRFYADEEELDLVDSNDCRCVGSCFLISTIQVPTYEAGAFPRPIDSYGDGNITSIVDIIVNRAEKEPFNVLATLIFFLAIAHTMMTSFFLSWRINMRRNPEYSKLKARWIKIINRLWRAFFIFWVRWRSSLDYGLWSWVLL